MGIVDSGKTVETYQNLSITYKGFDRGFILDLKDLEVFYFIEDIFSHSIVGVLRFRDMYGFYEFAPLTGDKERIIITYGVDKDITLQFDVYEIKSITSPNTSQSQGQTIIEITFVDTMYQLLTQQKFSRSWMQESVSSIVEHIAYIMLDVDSFVKFEESREKIDFAMPYWYPKQALMWLCRRGTSKVGKKPGYLFYNNTKGTNFLTLDALLRGSPTTDKKTSMTYKFDKPDESYFLNKILSASLQGIDNYQMNFLRGGHKFGYDFSSKSFITKQYEYSDLVRGTTILGNKTLYSDIGTPRADYVLEAEPDPNILDAMFISDWQKRYSLQQAVKIIVQGYESRFAGDMIELEWPSTEKEQKWNKQMKGLYLVKSVTNQWGPTRPGWVQKLVLLKNGYTDSRNRDLVKATRKNLYGSTASTLLGYIS
jgi:hypothetical protein